MLLKANVTGFVASLKTATQAAQDLGTKGMDAVGRNEQHIRTLSNGIGVLGIAMVGVAALAVKKFADFDSAMSEVAATGDDAKHSIEGLRAAALDAGAKTVFSATEAANAITALSKAGVSATDILSGGLDGALSLAAAGGLDVAQAAEIAATTMTQFGKSGKDVTHIADLLAAGAGKAQGEVADMALAMEYAGIPLAQLGVSMEEAAGTIALFAKNGIVGEKAGTQLRSMIGSLTSPSAIAAKTMAELGISVFDSTDKFIGMQGVAGVLEDKLGGLTQADRAFAMGRIFGNEAMQGANVLVRDGADAVAEWTAAVNDQGFAAEYAATKMDNLKGDIEQLSGSVETMLINFGSGADGPLRSMTQGLTEVVNKLGEMSPAAQTATLGIVGGGGLVALGLAGAGKLVIGLNDVRTSLKGIGVSAKTAGIAVGAVGGILTIAAIGLTTWIGAQADAAARVEALRDSLDETTGAITEQTRKLAAASLAKTPDWWTFDFAGSATEGAKDLGISLERLTDAATGDADAMREVFEIVGNSAEDLDHVADRAAAAGMSIGDYNKATSAVRREVQGQSKDLESAIALQDDINAAVGTGTEAQDAAADSYAGTTVSIEEQAAATEAATKALEEWRKMVSDSDASFVDLGSSYDAVIDKNTKVATSTADATKSSKDSWEDYYDGVSVSSTDYIAELQAQVDAQAAWEDNMLAISDRVKVGMTGDMATAAEGMIDELLDLGPKGAAQVALLKSMSDDEFAQVVTLWSQKGTDAVAEFTNKVEAYRQPVVTLGVQTNPVYAKFNQLVNDIGGANPVVTINADTSNARSTFARLMRDIGGSSVPFTFGSGHATGGLITGPGTGTSDSIPAMLSNREYVVKASAVQKYGPAFFDSVNAMRFSGGGLVGGGSAGSPGAAPSLAGLAIEGTLDLGNGLVGMLRGVVKSELGDASSRFRYAGGS